MKLRLSITLVACLAFVLGAAANAYSQTQTTITEDKAIAILNSMDKAAKTKNVAGMMAPLANDVKIRLIVVTPNKEQGISLTRDQYELNTRQAMRKRISYDCLRKNIRVKIFADGQSAMVSDDLYETLTLAGKTLRTVTSEVTIFYVRGGKIVITAMEGKMRFY